MNKTDISDRLRVAATHLDASPLYAEAAHEIERLRSAVEMTELTDEQCRKFLNVATSREDMIRAAYKAGQESMQSCGYCDGRGKTANYSIELYPDDNPFRNPSRPPLYETCPECAGRGVVAK